MKSKKLEKLILNYLLKTIKEDEDLHEDLLAAAEDLADDPDKILELVTEAQHEVSQKLKILLSSRPRPSKIKE